MDSVLIGRLSWPLDTRPSNTFSAGQAPTTTDRSILFIREYLYRPTEMAQPPIERSQDCREITNWRIDRESVTDVRSVVT